MHIRNYLTKKGIKLAFSPLYSLFPQLYNIIGRKPISSKDFRLHLYFTFQKYYAAQTLCSRSIIQKLYHILLLNCIQIKSLPHIVWQFCAFLFGNLARSNSYFNLHRLSKTPANISISLLEIPNRVAIFLICCFFAIIRIILFP